ncbi:hypothetical protein Syun_026732 [Stephania yunnanensis]|uniref:NADPH-dependent FMN and FAD-containing oxidoreductase n=1 Tax=Stephania yunnanensis TaxID=152371 RepID=A0AAP0EEC5_9MAGN
MEDKKGLLILFASQTGNAIDAAERVGREAERRGYPCSVLSMDEFDASDLPSEESVVFVASTTGQGENPDSMKGFWRFLLQRNLGNQWLERVHYAVFGLGDSSYQKYNFAAKKLDKRLLDLGAKPIIERCLGDDQHPSGYEAALDPWLSSLWSALNQVNPRVFPSVSESTDPAKKTLDLPKFQIVYHDVGGIHLPTHSTSPDCKSGEMQIGRARSMSPGKFGHNKNMPHCFLQMTKNQLLTSVDSGRDVRHFEFESVSSAFKYQVGDVLEILPSQDPVAVEAFIQRCNLNPDLCITVEPNGNKNGFVNSLGNASRSPVKLRTFVETTMDVASASPRRYFFEARMSSLFEVMSFFAKAEHEKERLEYFASPEGRDDLYQYNQKERRTVLEVLEDFPSVEMPFEWLVQLVPPLRTRAFSISSSPSAHPNQVHLTVSVVSWMTPYKRKRFGLCSTWLAGLEPRKRFNIPVWFHQGMLPPPSPSLPLILIGPGTGCAPFRGIVAERAEQSASGPTAPIIFFFGCRNEKDFLYRDFWTQPQKVYVQHKMEEESQRVWSLMTAGAAVYVAGSSTKMPADVLSSFGKIVSKEGGVPKESALRWLSMLEKAGKYHVEAWS